jgi:hypothetical protein
LGRRAVAFRRLHTLQHGGNRRKIREAEIKRLLEALEFLEALEMLETLEF